MNPWATGIRVAISLAASAAVGLAGDWPNFRGPSYDGVSGETGLKTSWDKPLPLLWEREVGSAFSSFACVGDRVYTCGTQGGQQVLFCLNAGTGAIVWQKPFEKEFPERQGGDGTRATPAVSDGRVYVFGARGRLLCCDAQTGAEVWARQFNNPPQWGYSGSVLIEGELAIASPGKGDGALAAFNRKTGEPVWKAGNSKAGYATPYPFTFEGKRYIAGFLSDSAMVVHADSGKIAWQMPWKTDWDVNAAAPLFHDGRLFFSSGYNHGAILLKLHADGDTLAAETVWQDKVLRNKFQSVVLFQGDLYSGDETGLKCVEFETGKQRWFLRRFEGGSSAAHATIVLAEGHLYVLSEDGRLYIAPASPRGFEPTTQAEILSGRCWTVPVLHQGRLYARSLERAVCFALRE